MKETPPQNTTAETLRRLAKNELKATHEHTENARPPELALFRVPSSRKHLIEEGQFTPEEIKVLDQLAEKHANLKAEQTAKETKRRFANGLNLLDQTSESESND